MVMVTRREFVKRLAGAALFGALLGPKAAEGAVQEEVAKKVVKAPPLPWPYVELDPEETRKLGHLGYYAFECSGGAFWAIAVQLREKVGYPWTLIPIPSKEEVLDAVNKGHHLTGFFQYGFGGVVGWGTICGAPQGGIMIMSMVVKNKKDWEELGRLLLRFYETTPFPSKKINEYAVKGELYPKKLKYSGWLPQSVSHSVLCHVSVSKWCMASGFASGSKERSERCGRLTGDVAAEAVTLLNAYFKGGLEKAKSLAKLKFSATTAACRECHYKGKDFEMGQFTRGFMQCETCHKDLRAHAHEFLTKGASGAELMTVGLGAGGLGAFAGFLAGLASNGPSEGEGSEEEEKEER
ncbi:Split soret cytochrome C precursor [Ignicoccus pacificus DSM 13166]|uniref:Split soret cytochrome C n=1 Tax=Ignicoccus pacificus DSM 13166 TaxID=940294 RepID=A0A977KA86_9CREN|nr:Split soret cytochrome C precursor [Ignicoccus pacificus DSM 13166]